MIRDIGLQNLPKTRVKWRVDRKRGLCKIHKVSVGIWLVTKRAAPSSLQILRS